MLPPFYLLLLLAFSIEAISLEKIKDAIRLETELLHNFREYAKELDEKINIINNALKDYKETIAEAEKDPELYVSNPINAFRLMRHMHQDWVNWQIYMKEQVGPVAVKNMESLLSKTPKKSIFKEAVENLQTITHFYQYEPSFLVSKNASHSDLYLSPLDCFYIGQELYIQRKYFEAAKWLSAAADNYNLSKYSHTYSTLGVPRWWVYQMQSKAFQNLNWLAEAFVALNAAAALEPHNVILLKQRADLENRQLQDPGNPLPLPETKTTQIQKQCQGNFPHISDVSCEYNRWVTPFLELAPLKLEEVLYEPYTVVYHDSIYSHEILHIRKAFKKCPESHKFQISKGRIVGCSIFDHYSTVTRRLLERILDMTGLMTYNQNLYVLEYGQLLDPVRLFQLLKTSPMFADLDFDEIEATAIMFLNDVKMGGAITIPNQKMTVYPRKGDTLISFHEGEFEHTLCPNVVGNGLVILKFLSDEDE